MIIHWIIFSWTSFYVPIRKNSKLKTQISLYMAESMDVSMDMDMDMDMDVDIKWMLD